MNMKYMKLLKLIDVAISGILIPLMPRTVRRDLDMSSHDHLRLLIIRPGGIGDAVLLIPAILAIKKILPESTVDILAEKRNGAVFLLCPNIDSVYHYDKPKELFGAVRGKYDIVIDTEQWHRLSAVVTKLVNAPRTIGYATNERKKMFTDPIRYSQDDYEVMNFINLIAPITGDETFDEEMPFLTIPETSAGAINHLLRGFGNRNIIAIFPGGSIVERKWGNGRFHQTAKLLCENGYGIVVVGGKDDVRAGEEITQGLANSINLCGTLSLPETAAILKESSLLITGDSGIMHIGYGLGIKVLALFGPGREKKWAPRGKNCKVINKNLPCSPCTTFGYTATCRENAACMSTITVEEVVREAMALLDA
jgi:ADP-heptose:LPS heptosyltransferase